MSNPLYIKIETVEIDEECDQLIQLQPPSGLSDVKLVEPPTVVSMSFTKHPRTGLTGFHIVSYWRKSKEEDISAGDKMMAVAVKLMQPLQSFFPDQSVQLSTSEEDGQMPPDVEHSESCSCRICLKQIYETVDLNEKD